MNSSASRHDSLGAAIDMLQGRDLIEEDALCLNVRGRGEHCHQCTTVCPNDALTVSVDAIEVDREACTACGACVPACPAGALRLRGFSPERFLAILEGEAEVHLHCTESRGSGGGVVIPCFKVLDVRLLAAAQATGVEAIHLHGLEHCAGCARGGALGHVARLCLQLEEWFTPPTLALRPATDPAAGKRRLRERADQPRLSRRSFLRFAGAQVAESMARTWQVAIDNEEDDIDLPFFQDDVESVRQPHPYQRLLAEHVPRLPWRDTLPLPWKIRSLGEYCIACLACGQRCPTGALLADEKAKALSISFEPALCTDCGLCEALCPVDAVQTRPAREVTEVSESRSVIMMRRQVNCDRCGTPFLPEAGQTTCPICINEQELDEEWLSMLGG